MTCSNSAANIECKSFSRQGVTGRSLTRCECTEYHLTALPDESGNFETMCRNAASAVRELGAGIVNVDVFGVPGDKASVLKEVFGEIAWPVTWVDEGHGHPAFLCGIQLWAVAGVDVKPIRVDGSVIGCMFETGGIKYCRLGGLVPSDLSASRSEQTRTIFELMVRGLDAAGMTFGNVLRTWFYNYNLLQWYGDFNTVRTTYFKEHGVFDGLVPASTGIGGSNAAGAALTSGLIAVKADSPTDITAMVVPSPLQCPAPNYGSSFSRAVELKADGVRRLFVSGTASIEPGGKSVHIGDVDAQIALTMEVADAILKSRNMDWSEVSRAIAYFKHGDDMPALQRYCEKRGIPEMPCVCANTDICRDDLLFEIEIDVIAVDN
jgi:enamine deaminase RidA (YjgF/YER057c/UK114 family)